MSTRKEVRSADLNSAKRINSLDFKILKIFKTVADSPSFRQAAKKLGTTQPHVTMRIGQLEEFLGIALFDLDQRDRRQNVLTLKGQEFLIHAKRLTTMLEKMEGAFRDPSTVGGIVRVGVSESIVHTWLPALLKQVDAAYPNLQLEIEVDISPKLQDLLAAGNLNLAFLLGPIDAPDLRSRPLCKFSVAFIASKEIALPRRSITLEDIVNLKHRIITFARTTQPHQALRDLLADRGLHATIWASASLEAVVRLALDGLGIAVVPPDILKQRVEARDRLRRLDIDIELPPLDYVVSWSTAPGTADDNTVQKVIDIAMKVAQEWPNASMIK
jgi:DNA-binding transcriptional LysR family regulator